MTSRLDHRMFTGNLLTACQALDLDFGTVGEIIYATEVRSSLESFPPITNTHNFHEKCIWTNLIFFFFFQAASLQQT